MSLLFVLFSRAKTRIYCSYINKNQSYVYNAIKSDINNDFFQFVSSSEILGNSVPKQSNEEAEKKVEEYFDGLDL